MELRSGGQERPGFELAKPRANRKSVRRKSSSAVPPTANRKSPSPLPCGPRELVSFRPQLGDVVIRDVPQTGTAKVIPAPGLIGVFRDDFYQTYQFGAEHVAGFQFRRGDQILRTGSFIPIIWRWVCDGTAELFLHWPSTGTGDETPAWYMVAQKHIDAPAGGTEPGTTFQDQCPVPVNREFHPSDGDYIIHRQSAPSTDRPWSKSFELRSIPHDFDERRPPALYGAGDVAVRIRVSPPRLDAGGDQFAPMHADGYLCLGGDHPVVYRWRFLGRDHHIFRDYVEKLNGLHPSHQIRRSPVRPGDIVFNLDEPLQAIESSGPSWLGGHVALHRDGPHLGTPPDRVRGSMILRLGSFRNDRPEAWAEGRDRGTGVVKFGRWGDGPVEMFAQNQGSPTGWVRVVSEGLRINGKYPPALTPFNDLFPDPQHLELGDSPEAFRPRTTDIISRREVNSVSGRRPARDSEHMLTSSGVPGGYVMVDRPKDSEIKYKVFFWSGAYRCRDRDCLFRFGTEPAHPEAGIWVLSIELYTFSLTPPKWRVPRSDYKEPRDKVPLEKKGELLAGCQQSRI
ncbi:hypothetical protein AXG93_4202s1110 [Marchantia polymorpha subsp. ruderalis]|uniref:Uncharacterized protein n=1 Tax=Marchantia polymorpha subsp. ruderalis TaxID=1480154 RepID=A0A176WGA7_MARPO|nr:hypothetical protein AXG93_4202s1110 [Marchantia polymorpha subsp. ruderalis]